MTTPTPLTAEEEADFDKRLAIGSDEYLTVFEQRRLLDAARAGEGPETGWRTPDDLIDELNATRQKLGDCEDALTTVETAYEVLDAARAGEGLDVERLARALVASGLMRRYADYANSLPTMKHGDENELAADWAFHIAREYAPLSESEVKP